MKFAKILVSSSCLVFIFFALNAHAEPQAVNRQERIAPLKNYYLENVRNEMDQPEKWAESFAGKIKPEEDAARDLIVFVHGFKTSPEEAEDLSEKMFNSINTLKVHAHDNSKPIFLALSWPSDTVLFGRAQKAASKVSAHLAEFLKIVDSPKRFRKIILIGYSLGAQVVMDTLGRLQSWKSPKKIDGVVLIQGAILGSSIRTWKGIATTNFPAAELDAIARGKPLPEPIKFNVDGAGPYFYSSQLAEKFIVTTSDSDFILDVLFEITATFSWNPAAPRTMPGPGIMSSYDNVRLIAIGRPFPSNPVFDIWPPIMAPELPDNRGGDLGLKKPETRLAPDPSKILQQTVVRYEFQTQHKRLKEIHLDELPGVDNGHYPLKREISRRNLLREIFALLEYKTTP